MGLHLRIENETSLPDGGPLSISVTSKRGIDIGRDSHLDWTLPDPTRYISSKHAEIRYKDGGYWLHDVSTNGTFVNGGDHRMQAPHRLRTGDRFTIGHYIIAVAVDAETGEAAALPVGATPAPSYQELWAGPQDAAPPVDRSYLRTPKERSAPVNPDFLDWAADVPNPDAMPSAAQGFAPPPRPAPRHDDDMSWAVGPLTPGPPPPPPAPPVPTPRRPAWSSEPDAPWTPEPGASPAAAARPFETPATGPAPARAAAPIPVPPSALVRSGGSSEATQQFLQRLALSAGVSGELFAGRDPAEVAEQLGVVMRLMADNVMQLLNARLQAKRLARSSSHTMIQAVDNNPLKFAPNVDEALRIMFGPPTQSYLDARRAIEQGFADLKSHQIKTYSAMQHALAALMAELEPQAIDQDTDADRGIAALMTSRKAKLWDAYQARYQALAHRDGDGLIDTFMRLFADYYDRAGGGDLR